MSLHKYEGVKIKLERGGEAVEGVLEGSHYGLHYNAHWTDFSGQDYVGLVTEEELSLAIEEIKREDA